MHNQFVESVIRQILKEKRDGKEYMFYTFFSSLIPAGTIKQVVSGLTAKGIHIAVEDGALDSRPDQPIIHLYICWSDTARMDASNRGFTFQS